MNFTTHNILLYNNEYTLDKDRILLSKSAAWTSIEKTINLFFPTSLEERKKLRVVDLGCLEGGYTVEFARLGFDSLGIEAREENLEKCNYAKSKLNLPNLNFVKDDVRNLSKYGKFDIVLCYGLLYHLHDPVSFINSVSQSNNKMLLLHTHFAPEFDIRYTFGLINKHLIAPIQRKSKSLEPHKNYHLSKIVENEGYRGRWYNEWSKNEKKEKVEKSLWASYNNHQSFWLCKKDLTKVMHRAGFDHVFEQFDYTGDVMPDNFTEYHSRTMFVAIKN